MPKKIDLGALAPEDIHYENVPCSKGTCTLILAGSLPLKDILEGINRAKDNLSPYNEENIEYLKKSFKLKTDPAVVEDAFNHLTTAHFQKFNEDIALILTTADSKAVDDLKKKTK